MTKAGPPNFLTGWANRSHIHAIVGPPLRAARQHLGRPIHARLPVLPIRTVRSSSSTTASFIIFSMERSSSRLPVSRGRSEEHTSELQSLMRISYAVFCLKTKTQSTDQLQLPITIHNYHKNHASTPELY